MSDKDTFFSKKLTINIHGQIIDLSSPSVMGIINVTPDSFYVGSRVTNEKNIIERAGRMISEGARFIDVGACSTRPGSKFVDEKTEKERLQLALSVIRKNFAEVIISVDTFRASMAEWAVNEYEAGMINDISGGTLDNNIFSVVARLRVPYVLMHMRGTPENMQENTTYGNLTREVITELSERVRLINESGVNDIIIDPGIGFAKTTEQNYQLISELEAFNIFELPVMVGVSRKSMIYKLLNITPDEALNGSTVLNTIALLKGANILRVHDVKEAVEAIKIVLATHPLK
jgi:dihydropteroate synthase